MTEGRSPSDDQLVAGRREHHRELLESGAYPYRFQRADFAAEIAERFSELKPDSETDTRVTVAGRIMLHRSFGKLQFATLQDGTGTIQLLVEQATAGEDLSGLFARIDLGDWVGVSGKVMTTKKGELSIRVDEMTMLQKAVRP
ncbi:MAG: OB-fold nucleic acid binding domain-containing protein, partial [Acidimicrobiia bacterium]